MTIESYTGTIDTQDNFESVTTLTGITFSSGTTYTMQIQGYATLKIGNAEFSITNSDPFQYVAGDDTLNIKTDISACKLSILENVSAS